MAARRRPPGPSRRALLLLPIAVAAACASVGAAFLTRVAGINATSPGGRYADPYASPDVVAPALGAGGQYDWPSLSPEGWAYRLLISRMEGLAREPRIELHVLGEVRYSSEIYPLVALTVSGSGGSAPRARVLLTGAVHGNEAAGTEALIRFAELVARSPALYRDVAFDIVPVVNPWGWTHDSRHNGAGKDINRDFSSSRTQEAALLRSFLASRTRANGPYQLALDHHESTKAGYFVYQYTNRRAGLGRVFARVVLLAGKPLENDYSEAGFRVRDGVLAIPFITLPYVSILGRLSLEQYVRLSGTRHSYTLESPLSDSFGDRVRIHLEGLQAMLDSRPGAPGASVEGSIGSAAR